MRRKVSVRHSWRTWSTLLCLAATLLSPAARAGNAIVWTPPVRISSDSATSNLPQCLVRGDTITVVWFGIDEFLRLSLDGVEVSQSFDRGATFTPPVSLLPFEVCLTAPLASQGGETIAIAVGAVVDTAFGTFLIRSIDGGAHWQPPRLLRSAAYPNAVAAEGNFFAVETIDPVTKAHAFLRSTDGGDTWAVANASAPEFTDMLIRDDQIHAVGPVSSRILHEVGYFSSGTRGSTWFGPEYLSSEDVTKSERGSIAMNDRRDLFAVWSDTGDVIVRASRNEGIFWGPHAILSTEPGTVTMDIGADAEFVVVVWDRDTGAAGEIRLRASDDFGKTFGAEANPVIGLSAAEPSIVVIDSVVHLTWHEHRGDTSEIYYRRGTLPHNPDVIDRPPTTFRMAQNYPNPFNGSTQIAYEVPAPGRVTLELFDILGRRVRTLVDADQEIGRYIVHLDGDALPSGVYLYRLRTTNFSETKKLTVLR